VVLLLFDSGTRIIHPRRRRRTSPDPIKLWNGDSHGHWEGNTLVVEVTNNNGKALFGRTGDFMSENGTVVERYVFDNAGNRFNYVATFTDPTSTRGRGPRRFPRVASPRPTSPTAGTTTRASPTGPASRCCASDSSGSVSRTTGRATAGCSTCRPTAR
jgi:hypothetical protein